MNTRRGNDKYHRQDIKIPVDLYNQVCNIATTEFNARVHHISKKPEITSTVLYLIQLGIQSLEGGKSLKKIDTDSDTDAIPITIEQINQLIADRLKPIEDKLNKLYTDINTDKNTDKNIYVHNLENTVDVTPLVVTEHRKTNNCDTTFNNTESTAPPESPTNPLEQDSGQIIPEPEEKGNTEGMPQKADKIGSFEEAKVLIFQLHGEGKNLNQIAKILYGKYFTKERSTEWQRTQVQRVLAKEGY
jgi:hypothetical protein